MKPARMALALAVVGVAAGGCGGSGGRGSLIHDVKFDVGGRVLYLFDSDRPLPDVTVTLVDVDGDTETATTSANGLWSESNLPPGPWIERFELAGYEPIEREFVLEIGGENDVENAFEGRPDAFLQETLLRATAAPFGVTAADGETFRDGFDGHAMEYSIAASGSIVVTFSRDVIDADGDLTDLETGQNVNPAFDPAANTLTFHETDIDQINGAGMPLTTDSDPWTWHRLDIDADAITPINGEAENFSITLFFNAVP